MSQEEFSYLTPDDRAKIREYLDRRQKLSYLDIANQKPPSLSGTGLREVFVVPPSNNGDVALRKTIDNFRNRSRK